MSKKNKFMVKSYQLLVVMPAVVLVVFVLGYTFKSPTRTYIPQDLVDHYQTISGTVQKKCVDGYCLELRYDAPCYVASKEILNDILPCAGVEERLRSLSETHQFYLRLSVEGKPKDHNTSSLDKSTLLSGLELMQEEIHIKTAEGEHECILLHEEALHSITPSRSFLLQFPAGQGAPESIAIATSFAGIVEFPIDKETLEDISQLQINCPQL